MSETTIETIESSILFIRNHRVLLDSSLAALYQVETKTLIQAIKRNLDRFPEDFMFQLTMEEYRSLRSQFVTSSFHGGRRYPPFVFTEQGVAMLSSVLNSKRGISVNIEIMRTFVKLRQMLAANTEFSAKLVALEKRYDYQFKVVFDAIRELMTPSFSKQRPIGFNVKDE